VIKCAEIVLVYTDNVFEFFGPVKMVYQLISVRVWRMCAGISITVSPVERRRLQAPHQGPQRCAEARLASPDHVADG
jgi:hypothetical protein